MKDLKGKKTTSPIYKGSKTGAIPKGKRKIAVDPRDIVGYCKDTATVKIYEPFGIEEETSAVKSSQSAMPETSSSAKKNSATGLENETADLLL